MFKAQIHLYGSMITYCNSIGEDYDPIEDTFKNVHMNDLLRGFLQVRIVF